MSQTHPLTTTTFELPGYRITKSFGVVRGIMVRSRSVIGNIGANIQSLFGGNITLYTNLCERAREDTFNLMLTHAGELGANAVVGVRYDATEIAPGITVEVITAIGNPLRFFSPRPIASQAESTCRRENPPCGSLGVGTMTKVISASETAASISAVARNCARPRRM